MVRIASSIVVSRFKRIKCLSPNSEVAESYLDVWGREKRIDSATREAREVDIYMNHPLRYSGLTFYQARMGRDVEDLNRGTSALQVVRNPGWLTPYAAVLIVAAGMYIQFRQHLTKFLNKRLDRDVTARKGRWGGIAGRLLEAGALGYLVLRFTLNLFGYAS